TPGALAAQGLDQLSGERLCGRWIWLPGGIEQQGNTFFFGAAIRGGDGGTQCGLWRHRLGKIEKGSRRRLVAMLHVSILSVVACGGILLNPIRQRRWQFAASNPFEIRKY